jgi:WD40 repeat protein
VVTGEQLAELAVDGWSVGSLAFGPDGRTLAAAGVNFVHLWDAITGEQRDELSGETWSGYGVAFSPDARLLAGAGADSVLLWDLPAGRMRARMRSHRWPKTVAFSPDGRLLASAGEDRSIRLWDVESGGLRVELAGHTDDVHTLAFSPDGRSMVSSGRDGVLHLWDLDSQTVWRRLPLGQAVQSVAWYGNLIGVAAQTVLVLRIEGLAAHAGRQPLHDLPSRDQEQDDQRDRGDDQAGEQR